MPRTPIRALVFKGTSSPYVAICLELDIGAQGATVQEAIAALEQNYRESVRVAERRGEQPFARSRPAPQEYWTQFEAAAPVTGQSTTFDQIRATAAP